jgi:hypothetical protein
MHDRTRNRSSVFFKIVDPAKKGEEIKTLVRLCIRFDNPKFTSLASAWEMVTLTLQKHHRRTLRTSLPALTAFAPTTSFAARWFLSGIRGCHKSPACNVERPRRESYVILYSRSPGTWVGRPSLKSYEEVFFEPYTFCRRKIRLIRAANAITRCFR